MSELQNFRFLGNTLLDWTLAALVVIVTVLVIPFVRGRLHAHRARWPDVPATPVWELLALLVSRTSRLVLWIAALYFAEKILVLPVRVDRIFDVIIVVGVWIQVGLWATTAARFVIQRRQGENRAAEASVTILMFGAQLLLWAVFVLLALDNLGVNITALVAGLGVGGVAVALAVQTILSDLFGSLSIAFDKPFQIGDSLRIDDIEGTVEHVGLKSTRLRSVTGEQIILANADVLKSRLRNLGRMAERRMLFKLNVAYDTPPAKLDAVPGIVQKLVESRPGARFVQCILTNLGAYAIEFETIYFLANRPEIPVAQTTDAINRGVLREFAAQGIRIAYPTQQLMVDARAKVEMPRPDDSESA